MTMNTGVHASWGPIVLAALVGVASGCAQSEAPTAPSAPVVVEPADPRTALVEAERRWASWRLRNYDYTLSIGCFCPPPRSVRFEVRDGVSRAPDADAFTRERFSNVERVDLVFARIRELLDRPPARFEATYDPTYGYPTLYVVDLSFQVADDEFGVSIDGFATR
jgi:hypothetical protein